MEYTDTIMVVDDSEMIVKVLSFIIKKAGYTVVTATDGEKALPLLDGRNIDLVITDLNMPNMGGKDLIANIRSSEHYRYIPIVLFMPDGEQNRGEYLTGAGATMLFDKNNIKEKIIPTIKKMLG